MRRWLLPEAIEDILPLEAESIERLRRLLLDEFSLHGYELVAPPLLEYLESLYTGSGRDMDLRTLKLVDQLSGRTMGIRADITPQVARIDAHLLNRKGVTRLCYCGSVLHALPASLTATREPLQIGAELYGHAGLEADGEMIRLLARVLGLAGVAATRIDLGHVGIFRALAARADFDPEREQELFNMLQAKDVPALREFLGETDEAVRSALLALPECYGGRETLAKAKQVLPADAEITQALTDLQQVADQLGDLPITFDLADLRGYHYHSGIVFAAYCARRPGAIAQGGRYDKIGKAFGRGRAATGFSLDLRDLAQLGEMQPRRAGVIAPWGSEPGLREAIQALRAKGEIVIEALPGHEGTWTETGCDRRLVKKEGRWQVIQGAE